MQHKAQNDIALRLNAEMEHHGAWDVLNRAHGTFERISLVSSFGAESVVLLHMVSLIDRTLPVVFIDTEMLFEETLEYQRDLSERLGLKAVRIIRADATERLKEDPEGIRHQTDPDGCCDLRKTRPLARALDGHDGWITGRKRYQGGERRRLEFFEVEADTGRIKINPLAKWRKSDLIDYMNENRLPRHPMVARGYASIGCAPCTSPVREGESERAGRWRGEAKTECGIHIVNGRVQPAKKDVRV